MAASIAVAKSSHFAFHASAPEMDRRDLAESNRVSGQRPVFLQKEHASPPACRHLLRLDAPARAPISRHR
jgi:hypothetical protein